MTTIPEGIPHNLNAEEYKSEIRKRLGDTEVELFNLIETIISLYGIDIVKGEKAFGGIVICNKLNKYINESILNKILRLVLECDPKIAYAMTSNQQLIEKFRFYYDTIKGYGVITIK